jgi:hypothetical protein
MMVRLLARTALLLGAMLLLTSCLDDLFDFFEIIAYSESDDPEIRETGETIAEIREEREVQEALDRYAETGDPRHLEAARELRPNDTAVRAYDVVQAMLGGDPAQIEAAKAALALAESQRLASLQSDDYQFETSAEMLRRNVLGEILVAQTNLLGGSLNEEWAPPGPDASPETQQLFADYCATRRQILVDHNDNLSYLPPSPCP